jgi:beta-lactamase class A
MKMPAMLRSTKIFVLLLFSTTAFAQVDMERELHAKFETELKDINRNFHGVLGAEFVDLTDGQKISLNADTVFPTASTIKVAILLELFRQAEQKPDLLKQQRPFAARDGTGASGMARLLSAGSLISIEDIAKLMINLSENTATNLLIDEVGMDNVNRLISTLGFSHMKLQRKMLAREAGARGQENIATPAEGAALMTRLAQCEVPVSKASCDRARQILEIPQDPHPAKDAIPRNIPIAFKWGGLEGVVNGWAIVSLPDRPYVFAIMSTFGEDDGAAAVRAASEAAFHYYSRLARANAYGVRNSLDVVRKERANQKKP